MNKRRDDIEKYVKGELTAAEMHALEKEALSDPFLAEALEGCEQLGAVDFSKDVAELNAKIMKRKSTSWAWPVRIAASLLLLAVSAFTVWIALKQDPEQPLAFEQNLPVSQDSLPLTETKPAPTVSETERLKESNSPLPAESAKETPGASKPGLRSKKPSSEHLAENKKTEQVPELSETVMDTGHADDKVSTRITESQLDKPTEIATLHPNKKDELLAPSAPGIKLAEGYIVSVDARPTIVTGRVMSAEDGTPLPDVSVVLKGTSIMTKTDAHGRYAITADSRDKTLVYSSDGLESTEVKIDGVDSTYLPVKLEITEEAQEEAAVEASGMRDFGPTHVYTIPAHPETGNRAFKQYLEKNHKYPKEAKETNVEGIVVIEFKVEATGALSEFKIVRGIGKGCDEELIRLILQGVKWIPTTKDGIPVSDKARVKFKFELEE
jgi:TonB family protein